MLNIILLLISNEHSFSKYLSVIKYLIVYVCVTCLGIGNANCSNLFVVFWHIRQKSSGQRYILQIRPYVCIIHQGCEIWVLSWGKGIGKGWTSCKYMYIVAFTFHTFFSLLGQIKDKNYQVITFFYKQYTLSKANRIL